MIKFAMLTDMATEPTRKHETDAGTDLYANLGWEGEHIDVHFGDVQIVTTGVSVSIPKGFFGWITNKSRNDFIIGGGIVDEGYQGELLVKVINPTKNTIRIEHGQAIAQLLVIPCLIAAIEVHDDWSSVHQQKSERGTDGGIVRQVKV